MADESKKTIFRKIVVPEEEKKKKFLVGNTPPFVGKTIELNIKSDKGSFSVGRVEGNDLHIPFETVSSNHAKIKLDGDPFQIEDNNSSNGTFINNNQIQPGKTFTLNHKDLIRFDTYEYIFIDSARSDLWETLKPLAREGSLIITLYSPKGGTGITSVALNLAYALAMASKKKVAIADLNISFGDVLTYSVGKPALSMLNLLQEANLTGDVIGKYLQQGPGFSYLAAPSKAEDAERVNNWGKENPNLLQRILWSLEAQHDFVIVDLKNELDDISLTVLEISNLVYVFGHPEIGHMLAVRKILDIMDKLKYPESKVKVLMNRIGREGTLSEEEIQKLLKRTFTALPDSPNDAILTTHGGQLYTKERPDCPLSQAVSNLARTIRGEEMQAASSGGIFSKLRSILGL